MTQGWVAFTFGALAALAVGIFMVLATFGDVASLFAVGSPAQGVVCRVAASGILSALVALVLWLSRPISRGMIDLVILLAAALCMLNWRLLTLPFALLALGSSVWWRLKTIA